MIEIALVEKLESISALTTVVSTRIYPNRIPQDAVFPAVRYQKLIDTSMKLLGGSVQCKHARFQVDCYARDYSAAKSAAQAIRGTRTAPSLEEFFLQTMGSGPNAHWVDCITFEDDSDGYENPPHGEANGYHFVRLDFVIAYKD